jgi:hypothetical protein
LAIQILHVPRKLNEFTGIARIGDARSRAMPYGSGMYQTPGDRPIYRLLTGADDRAFCERVSEALLEGWRLYGSPTITWDEEAGCMKAAQAVVWHEANVVK